jgi:serine protease Do
MKIFRLHPVVWTAALLAAGVPRLIAGEGAAPKTNANIELARQLNSAFVQIAEDVTPSVVVITVVQNAIPSRFWPGGGRDDGSDTNSRLRRPFRQQQTTEEGSGTIIRADGFILTNRHVVEDAESIEVRLKDGRKFKATVRGVDAPSDVAVIKIDATNLPAAKLADSSKTRVGEFAIAIGAPFALDYSVTFGHVSAKDRYNILTDDSEGPAMLDQSFIQTDANINPGNSGGPLVNIDGEVIGINTLIRGLRTGIGFAIPSNLAREVADKLITDGKFTRSWLGVRIVALSEYPSFRSLVTGVTDGVVVHEIIPDGPASKSGLQPADVITAVDGKAVSNQQQLKDEVRTKKIGQDVALSVYRQAGDKGQNLKIIVKPGEFIEPPAAPAFTFAPPADNAAEPVLGFKVDVLRRGRGRGRNQLPGVVVTQIEPDSLAERSEIREGDIITAVGGQPVTNPKQFADAAKAADVKKGVMIHYLSQGASKFEILKEGKN